MNLPSESRQRENRASILFLPVSQTRPRVSPPNITYISLVCATSVLENSSENYVDKSVVRARAGYRTRSCSIMRVPRVPGRILRTQTGSWKRR